MSDIVSVTNIYKNYEGDYSDGLSVVKTDSFQVLSGGLSCHLCKNTKGYSDNYLVLSCNHVYHVGCFADVQFEELKAKPIVDNEYCFTRRCAICENSMCLEDLLFLHTKFLSNTKSQIEQHQKEIDALEAQMQRIKEELNVCYEYKGKLELQREKSKAIVSNITTLL